MSYRKFLFVTCTLTLLSSLLDIPAVGWLGALAVSPRRFKKPRGHDIDLGLFNQEPMRGVGHALCQRLDLPMQPYIHVDLAKAEEMPIIDRHLVMLKEALGRVYQDSFFGFDNNCGGPLKLVLAPMDAMWGSGAMANYDQVRHQIFITFNAHYNQEDYYRSLRNEFFSSQVAVANEGRGVALDRVELTWPFVNAEGGLDRNQFKRFKQSIHRFKKRMDNYKRWLKFNSSLKPRVKEKLKRLTEQVAESQYVPRRYWVSPQQLKQYKLESMVTKPDVRGRFEAGSKYPGYLPRFFGQTTSGGGAVYTHCNEHGNRKRLVIAFISDLEQQYAALRAEQGPYQAMGEAQRYSEWASFIAEMPRSLMRMMAPEFLEYMTEFFESGRSCAPQAEPLRVCAGPNG